MASLDHVGLATQDAETLAALLEALAGGPPFKSEVVTTQGVTANFLPASPPAPPAPTFELLEPTDAGSPVARFLEKRGPGLHHLALRVPRVEAAMARAAARGLRLLSDEPQPGAGGKRIAFLHPKDTGGVLIELCEHTDPLPDPGHIPFAHEGTHGTLATYAFGSPKRPPVLLLHGVGGCTRRETRALAHRLAPHARVVALDFPGHGQSSAFAERSFTPALLTASVRAVFEHFGLEGGRVFGFSTGGNVALRFARRHPERTERLAVHGTCITWTGALAEKMTERLTAKCADAQPLLARSQAFVRALPERTGDLRQAAERIEAPTLVSTADRDALVPLEATLALYRRLPEARLAVVPGRRHALEQALLGPLLPSLAKHLLPEPQS